MVHHKRVIGVKIQVTDIFIAQKKSVIIGTTTKMTHGTNYKGSAEMQGLFSRELHLIL